MITTCQNTLKQLILARLFCLPNSLLVAKKQEIAQKRIYEQIKRDLLKLFEQPDPYFVAQFQILLQESVAQYFQFSGTALQLLPAAKKEAIDFLGLSGQRNTDNLTWEEVRTIHLIAFILELPPKQRDRVKNEGKLQASILVRFHSHLEQHALTQGSLAQVARELSRLAIGAPSSRMGDLKKTLLAQWTHQLMINFLAENPPISTDFAAMIHPINVTVSRAISPIPSLESSQVISDLSSKEKNPNANELITQFVEQIKIILQTMPEHSLLISDVWQKWKNQYEPHSDLTTFKQLLMEAYRRNLLQLITLPSSVTPSPSIKNSELLYRGQIYHSIQSVL
ncbi:hypothetical protein [Thioflexithrix psekupsensis]|uniref:Uncharacterized protein n=1 Tax=Thioflexithrix psekupsensis TaxID=1570016 RepID=A0A251X7T5_9GAMM|nr:hypothetical protein [Thioflexithrix psekupsensis]OUD13269.1 hypothetical protein TPSD3_11605 [Thioflexithrix psekupsensis]